jgi:bacterioferritin
MSSRRQAAGPRARRGSRPRATFVWPCTARPENLLSFTAGAVIGYHRDRFEPSSWEHRNPRRHGGPPMKGDKGVITHLNTILTNELTSINQYFLHARMFKNWGFEELDEVEYKESIDEMKHADTLINRILFLEGLPNVQKHNKILVGEDVGEALKSDLTLELTARKDLQNAIGHCEKVQDYVSRDLLVDIMESEEEHIDWLETQTELIEKVGLANYLQSQMSPGDV